MRYAPLLSAIALILPSQAMAQTEDRADQTPLNCIELVADLAPTIAMGSQSTIQETPTGCRITDFFIVPGAPTRFKVAELVISAPGLFEDWAAKRLPAQVDLNLNGVILSPETGSELATYMVEMQADPMTVHLAYRWDQTARTIDLADLSVSAPQLGSFRFAGRMSNIKIEPSALGDLRQQGGTLDNLMIEIDNARFFSSYLAPILVSNLPFDQDPRPLIDQYIASATSFIEGLPNTNVSDDSKAALVAFVQGFPRITGDYIVELNADPGLDLTELSMGNTAAVAEALTQVKVAASHTPPDLP